MVEQTEEKLEIDCMDHVCRFVKQGAVKWIHNHIADWNKLWSELWKNCIKPIVTVLMPLEPQASKKEKESSNGEEESKKLVKVIDANVVAAY